MTYIVKEIFYTLQGEGANTGRAAVLLRFAGCNLWTGRTEDRANAVCGFCDTDFWGTDGPGGGNYAEAVDLADAVNEMWKGSGAEDNTKFVVCTGGEPLLQLDLGLVEALHARQFTIAVETNGTIAAPEGIDWLCVSPKAGVELVQKTGDELKLVYPQEGLEPREFELLEFEYFFLQPLDGPQRERNTGLALDYCRNYPRWRLSLQI
ncbi:7-carboxy-7-deazaguanine synthase, partial [Gemmatimonadota bacterium]